MDQLSQKGCFQRLMAWQDRSTRRSAILGWSFFVRKSASLTWLSRRGDITYWYPSRGICSWRSYSYWMAFSTFTNSNVGHFNVVLLVRELALLHSFYNWVSIFGFGFVSSFFVSIQLCNRAKHVAMVKLDVGWQRIHVRCGLLWLIRDMLEARKLRDTNPK